MKVVILNKLIPIDKSFHMMYRQFTDIFNQNKRSYIRKVKNVSQTCIILKAYIFHNR